MKIISPDAKGQVDCALRDNILIRIPEDLPVAIVPISYFPDYQFVQPMTNYYVLMDFSEPCPHNDEINKFWNWVINNPPVMTFRRELKKKHVTTAVKPVEWPCLLTVPPVQSKMDYDRRPFDVLFIWGFSNLSRARLHGQIFTEGIAKHGLNVIDNWEDIEISRVGGDNRPPYHKLWVSIYVPWYRRRPMAEVEKLMSLAKITVSLPGNGLKTFRDTECVGTLQARLKDNMAFAFPWNKSNSIELRPELEFEDLLAATHRNDLYDLYLKCQENIAHYRPHPYVHDYIVSEIRKIL